MLELFCWWELATEDERVEPGFVDNGHLLCSTKGVAICDSLIIRINMFINCISNIFISKFCRNFLTDEPEFIIFLLNNSKSTKLWMSEHCWGICWRRRFWKMSRPGDVPSLCAFFQRCLFVTHPHSSRRKNAYSILPPGERDRINFVKYCWLYSSISLRNQSLFPEEHFPSHARKINPLAVYSIRPTILPVTSPLYSRIFSALLL